MLQYTPGKFPVFFLEKIVKFYRYKKCSTCVKALKYLEEKGVALDIIEIREEPPLLDELKLALETADGNIKALLNTSGMDYRQMGLKDKLPNMSDEEVMNLLTSNGNLVKRPLVVVNDQKALCGFKEAVYNNTF